MSAAGLEAMRLLLDAPSLAAARARAPSPEIEALMTPAAFKLVKRTAAEADHASGASPETWAAVFDRLAERSPEASVALYSLGDPARLEAATAEVVDWLRREGLLGPDRLVVEIGCGIGRFLRALSSQVEAVVGLDVSAVMTAEARDRTAGLANVVVLQTPGRDLSMIDDEAADLILAVDSFPYLVGAGLAEAHLAEAARVLRPGGELVVFNWSYRGDEGRDCAEAGDLAKAACLSLLTAGERPLELWDGALYRFHRP